MDRASRLLIWSGLMVLLLLGIAYSAGHVARVQDYLIRRVARQRLRDTHSGLFALNQISVVLCGTGVPAPDRDRASACTAVFVAGRWRTSLWMERSRIRDGCSQTVIPTPFCRLSMVKLRASACE